MRASGGRRLEWSDIPRAVRASITEAIGAEISAAHNQPGGFSPGLAARCELVGGGRVFVKAVSPEQNPHACRIHRREAEIAGQLPGWVPAPTLRHVVDDGHWVALVFDDVSGRPPHEPWTLDELDVVMPAVRSLGESLTPSPVTGLQSVVDKHRPIFSGFRRLAAGDGDPAGLPTAARKELTRLARIEEGWEAAAGGVTMLHADLRADNVLIGDDGAVTFVDWPWGCVGRSFLDPLFMLPSIGLAGGPDPAAVVERYGLFEDVADDDVLAVLAALTGFFFRAALDPAPPGIPTLPAFQAAQGEVALRWLRTLL